VAQLIALHLEKAVIDTLVIQHFYVVVAETGPFFSIHDYPCSLFNMHY
jgi:hypothetical protein